jgi:hypothetical protein
LPLVHVDDVEHSYNNIAMARFHVFTAEASYCDGLNRSVRLARRLFRNDFIGPPLG